VIRILDSVAGSSLNKVESLLAKTDTWDNVARNDFCRYVTLLPEVEIGIDIYRSFLHAVRAVWSGLPTVIKIDQDSKQTINPCKDEETEVDELILKPLNVAAGFALTDPNDYRYQTVLKHRQHFGEVVNRAAGFLQANHEGEDHIDAVMATLKAIDIYMLEYGMTRSSYDSLRKNYAQARE
jgi:proteasome activator subunit 4